VKEMVLFLHDNLFAGKPRLALRFELLDNTNNVMIGFAAGCLWFGLKNQELGRKRSGLSMTEDGIAHGKPLSVDVLQRSNTHLQQP
jgi:hypothetical protein